MTNLGRGSIRSSLLFALLVLGCPGSATADGGDPGKADRLFLEGREAAKRGDWLNACPKFRESQALDPKNGTLLNLADCEERLGHLATAYAFLSQLLKLLPERDDRVELVERKLALLGPRIPRLSLVGDLPEDARVEIDGVPFPLVMLGKPRRLDPGGHVVLVHLRSRGTTRHELVLVEGESRELSLSQDASPGGTAKAPSAAPATRPIPAARETLPEPASTTSGRRTSAYVLGGVGLAGLAVGGYFGIKTLTDTRRANELCPERGCANEEGLARSDDAGREARIANVGIGLGVAALVVGAYLLLTEVPPTGAAARSPRLVPSARGLGGSY